LKDRSRRDTEKRKGIKTGITATLSLRKKSPAPEEV